MPDISVTEAKTYKILKIAYRESQNFMYIRPKIMNFCIHHNIGIKDKIKLIVVSCRLTDMM